MCRHIFFYNTHMMFSFISYRIYMQHRIVHFILLRLLLTRTQFDGSKRMVETQSNLTSGRARCKMHVEALTKRRTDRKFRWPERLLPAVPSKLRRTSSRAPSLPPSLSQLVRKEELALAARIDERMHAADRGIY
jgi:hypothetical protein